MSESVLSSDEETKQKAWNPFLLFWVSIFFSSFAGCILLADQFKKLGHPEKRNEAAIAGGILGVFFIFSSLFGMNYGLLFIINILSAVFLTSWQIPLFSDFRKERGITAFWIKPAAKAFSAGALFVLFLISIQETRQSIKYRPYETELSAAQQLREEGDLEAAEKNLAALGAKQPEEPAAFIELSYTYEDMGILDSALKQAQTALEKTTKAMNRGNLFLNRLRLLRWKKNLEARIQELPLAIQGQEAIRIWSTGDQDGALAKLTGLQKEYPSAYQPHAAAAVLYKNRGDIENSIKEAETGLEKIGLKLKSKKISPQMRRLIEEDRVNLEDIINELRVLYSED